MAVINKIIILESQDICLALVNAVNEQCRIFQSTKNVDIEHK